MPFTELKPVIKEMQGKVSSHKLKSKTFSYKNCSSNSTLSEPIRERSEVPLFDSKTTLPDDAIVGAI